MIAHRVQAGLCPDPARVVARLFLPGEELSGAHSRASQVVGRVMSLAEDEVERLAADLLRNFGDRHHNYQELLRRHASIVSVHIEQARELTAARTLLLGATFTAEYATEAAGLCNPSAVLGPDQSGLRAGQARVALSVRGIGEGHISSIGFCSAVVGPGAQWTFESRLLPVSVADTTPASWHRTHLHAVLADQGPLDELAQAVLHALPAEFESVDLERALAKAHRDLLTRAGSAATVDLLRKVVSSAYNASFATDVDLSQRILSPSADEESNGMEDARFTRFADDDGTTEYRATYTAYDGRRIAPRLLTSSDLRVFSAHRLAGPAARNKGMALFPRKVHGRHLALCRSDGESTSLASSADGYVWERPVLLAEPSAPWEMLQVGNCGPPIETDQGWLVLTHGVGPMRVYVIGALLLDLDDPTRVVGCSRTPLLSPGRDEQDGYVPNVVYSCGAFLHDGLVWIPYGIDDCRIGVAYAPLGELLADLSSAS
ncbi:MAG TPA: glycoside hydrolase family 130 protein [Streptosporangiaceae bacterium]|nr:glycoside hydrolase family 130 protein [Streptosporangiaceae bacterium]